MPNNQLGFRVIILKFNEYPQLRMEQHLHLNIFSKPMNSFKVSHVINFVNFAF
jgi:hypothetical protein